MSRAAAVIIAFLAGGGKLRTRLRERGTGDVHDLPTGPLTLAGVSLWAHQVVATLEALAQRGEVLPTLTVHPWDSAEYGVHWRLTAGRWAEQGEGERR
jgi:hypothetical protein